jgi:hypothetical protein
MVTFLDHIWMCPERYRTVRNVRACHCLWDMAGLWHSVVLYVSADVSVEHAAYIFTDETTATRKIQAESGYQILVVKT